MHLVHSTAGRVRIHLHLTYCLQVMEKCNSSVLDFDLYSCFILKSGRWHLFLLKKGAGARGKPKNVVYSMQFTLTAVAGSTLKVIFESWLLHKFSKELTDVQV